jgi:hypothetical protein
VIKRLSKLRQFKGTDAKKAMEYLNTEMRQNLLAIESALNTPAGFNFTQNVAALEWNIEHNLGYKPIVVAYDDSDTILSGTVVYPNLNQVIITFASAETGRARLV